jgi:MscS family membrane protein
MDTRRQFAIRCLALARHPTEKIFPGVFALVPLVLILSCAPGAGQTPAGSAAKPQDLLNRDTPRNSVYSFLETCHARNYERAGRYLDLRQLSPDERLAEGPQLAKQLAQILDHDVQFDVGGLSNNPLGPGGDPRGPIREHVDSLNINGRRVDLELERVTFPSGLTVWLFSADSVKLIPQLTPLLSDSPIERHLPPPLVNWKLMDTSLWRWIALILLAAALASLAKLLSRLALMVAEMITKRLAPRVNRMALEVFDGPLRLLLSVAGFRAGMEWAAPSALLRLYLERVLSLLFFAGIFWFCAGIVDIALNRLRKVMGAKNQTFSYALLPLASRVIKLVILLLTIAAILSAWGYNTTTIMAGLGVGGLAIALAAQKTIENLFGGVAVISDRPVFVGDFCKFGDRVGTVEDIGLRSTRIRTPDRTLVSVPNSQFSSMTLENYSKRDKMLFHFTLNLRRDTTPDQVRTLLDSLTKSLTNHPKVEAGAFPVRFIGVGTYSLDLEIFVYLLTRDGDEFLQMQQELLLSILDEVRAAGTSLALPTQASVNYSSAAVEIQPHEPVHAG